MIVEELSRLPLKSNTGEMYSAAADTERSVQHRRMPFDVNEANKKHVCACSQGDHCELQKVSRDSSGLLDHTNVTHFLPD